MNDIEINLKNLMTNNDNEFKKRITILEGKYPIDIKGYSFHMGTNNKTFVGDGKLFKIDYENMYIQLKNIKTPSHFLEKNGIHYYESDIFKYNEFYGFYETLNTGFLSNGIDHYITNDSTRPWMFNADTMKLIKPIFEFKYLDFVAEFKLIDNLRYFIYIFSKKIYHFLIKIIKLNLNGAHSVYDYDNNLYYQYVYTDIIDMLKHPFGTILALMTNIDEIIYTIFIIDKFYDKIKKIKFIDRIINNNKYTNGYGLKLLIKKDKEEIPYKFKILDEDSNNLSLFSNFHQLQISKNYIVLLKTGFYVEILKTVFFIFFPFITSFLKNIFDYTIPPYPYSFIYVIKKDDVLKKMSNYDHNDENIIYCKKFVVNKENAHFEINEIDNNLEIIIFHNNGQDLSESIENDDVKFYNKHHFSENNLNFFPASTENNIITKYILCNDKLNYKSCILSPMLYSMATYSFFGDKINKIHINGLHTYKYKKFLFITSNGYSKDLLPERIFKSYKKYRNKISNQYDNINFYLVQIDVQNMSIKSYYESKEWILLSPTCVGEKYICVFACKVYNIYEEKYPHQIWIFTLKKDELHGPICKFTSEEFRFCITLHSFWMDKIVKTDNVISKKNIFEDYDFDFYKGDILEKSLNDFYLNN